MRQEEMELLIKRIDKIIYQLKHGQYENKEHLYVRSGIAAMLYDLKILIRAITEVESVDED